MDQKELNKLCVVFGKLEADVCRAINYFADQHAKVLGYWTCPWVEGYVHDITPHGVYIQPYIDEIDEFMVPTGALCDYSYKDIIDALIQVEIEKHVAVFHLARASAEAAKEEYQKKLFDLIRNGRFE